VFCIYQIKADQGSGKAFLDLNPFFYPPEAIEKTVEAFKELCSIKTIRQGQRLELELSAVNKADCETIALNFLNYALSLRREM